MRYMIVVLLLTVAVFTLAFSQTTNKKPKQNEAVATKHAATQHGSGLVLQAEQGTQLRVPGGERSLRMRDRDLHIVISPERSLRKPVANTKVKKLVLTNKTASLPPFSESLTFHHRTAYGDVFDSGTLKDYIERVGSGLKYRLERHGFSLVDPDEARSDDVLVLEWNVTSVAVYGWRFGEKARAGNLSLEEHIEMDSYERVGQVLSLMKSKARKSLKKARAAH